MIDQLVLTSVTAKQFGGLSDFTLPFGSKTFVVVFGPNESGKSTISELISWLLVGPSGSAEDAKRYGDSGDFVTGLLKGTVSERQFEATGKFRIGERGAPSDSGLKVGFAGQDPIGIEEWRELIAGLTPKMYKAIYWMAGKDLHDDTSVRKEIMETGGLAGISLSSVTEKLDDMIKSSLSATGKTATSFATLNKEKDAVGQEIMDIRSNANDYTWHVERIETLTKESSDLEKRVAELSEEIEAREILIGTIEARRKQKDVSKGIEDLDPIPPEWLPIAQSLERFAMRAEKLDHWTEEVATRRKEFLDACRIAGTDEADGRLVNVHPADLQSITRTGVQLTNNVEDLRRVKEELVSAESDYEAANENLATCSATAKHLGVNLESIPLGYTPSTALDTPIALWKQAELDAESKATEKTALDDKVREHENHVARLREAWEKFGTRVTAQKFLDSGPKPPPSRPHAIRVSPLVVAGAVAVVANFALPRVTGGIVAAVALGIGMALTRWWPRKLADADPPSAAEPTGSGETDHPRAAAEAVVNAEQDREGAISRQEAAQGELDQRTQRRNELAEASRSSAQGFDLGDEVGRAAAIVDAVTKAVTARSVHQAALKLKTNKSKLHDKHDQEVTEHKSTLRSMMVECAVPERIEVDDIEDLIESFADLTGTRMELVQAEADKATAQEEWRQVVGSVPDGETEPAILLTRAQNYASINEEKVKLEGELSVLSRSIDQSFGKNPLVKKYSQESHSELVSRQSDLANERSNSDDRREAVLKEIGTSDGEKARLGKLEERARLELKSGALNEAAEEHMLAGTFLTTALHVREGAVEEHRLANQNPVLTSANKMLVKVQTKWEEFRTSLGGDLSVIGASGEHLDSEKLSTGMTALFHLTLRLAVADHDAQKRDLRLPILCDDPLVHIDDIRAPLALPLLKEFADRGHQVILFTCKGSTFEAAKKVGAHPVELVR